MKAKLLILLALTVICFSRCKKDQTITNSSAKAAFTEKAKQYAAGKMPPADFAVLNWQDAAVYEKNGSYVCIKIPLQGQRAATDKAVYLQYENNAFSGNYFAVNKSATSSETITTTSLDNVHKCVISVTPEGGIGAYQKYESDKLVFDSRNGRNQTTSIGYVVTYINNAGQILIWMSMLGAGQNGSSDPLTLQNLANYGTLDYLSPDPSVSNPMGGVSTEIIELEYDDWEAKPAVDIVKLFKCFDEVPDFPGTTWEITLNADVPMNRYPGLAIDFRGSPGHAFLTITKSNGAQSVSQNFGFYPGPGPSSMTLDNVPSKIVNDEFHEVNAKISSQIDWQTFSSIRANALYLASQQYNLQTNNCTDFALKLFNLTRPSDPIQLPVFSVDIILPGVNIPISVPIVNAPQTLFAELKRRKDNIIADAANIVIDQTRGTKAPGSKGECN